MMQASSSVSYPALQENYGLGKLPRVRKRMERSSCIGRVWIFLLLGVILVILGLVVIGVYLNIQTTTSSSAYTEVFPMYINAAVIIGAGLFVVPLFWKRLKLMVFTAVVISMVTGLFSGITAVVTATHILQPIRSFRRCQFYMSQELCQCFSPYQRDGLDIRYVEDEETKFDFENTTSCSVIQNTLPQLLLTVITVYSIAILLCVGASIVALLVLRIETNKRRFFQDDAYEEVFTVSASSDTSHNQSDSETEGTPEVVTSPSGHVTVPINHSTPTNHGTSVSHVTTTNQGIGLSQQTNVNIKPPSSDSTFVKSPVTSKTKTRTVSDSSDQVHAPQRRHSKTPDKISKTSVREADIGKNSLTISKRLSRSCDSLDTSGCQVDTENQDLGTSQSDGKQKGKLKGHRRKGRRAVTLHNLDTKQLMLILNLQMRYLEETKAYNSQKDIHNIQSPRRAITPQPSSHQPKIPQNIRSHTPQPYRRQNTSVKQQERDFYAQISSLYQSHMDRNVESDDNSRCRNDQVVMKNRQLRNKNNTAPFCQGKHNPYLYGNRGSSAENMHFVTYSDNMLNFKGPKPKSRATVQDYFLPPQPIHRQHKHCLPPQPIRRQKSVDQNLPSEPASRGKSAFHIVDCGRNNSCSSSVSSERSNPPCHLGSTSAQKKHKNDYAEVAIRDNFQLNQNPYMLKNTQLSGHTVEHQSTHNKFSDISSKSMKSYVSSEIPPPYTGPPSYLDFVSSCDNSATSSTSSNQEEIYSRPVRRNTEQNSTEQKYAFEIETKNLLKQERDRNYNVRQPNLDSVYGYTETLNDVQNCHGDIRVKGVRSEGQLSQSCSKAKQNQELERESVYSIPAKSKVKQLIVPEDYYTPINKISRHTPVYANSRTVASTTQNTLKGNITNLEMLLCDRVKHRDKSPITSAGKFSGYVYPAVNQIAPDEKYHEYEDVYDTPEPDQPELMTCKEVSQMKIANNERNEHSPSKRSLIKSSKASPKKSKVKPYTYSPNTSSPGINTEKQKKIENVQNVDTCNSKNSRYNVPIIQVNDGDITEDDVFITDHAVNEDNHKNIKYKIESSDISKPNDRSRETTKHPESRKLDFETECGIENQTTQALIEDSMSDHRNDYHASHSGLRSEHMNSETSESIESEQERQVPEGTDDSSDNLVDNSSEEEYAETGV